jgi:hypothetical protein
MFFLSRSTSTQNFMVSRRLVEFLHTPQKFGHSGTVEATGLKGMAQRPFLVERTPYFM